HYWTTQLTTTVEYTHAITNTTTPTTTYLEIGPGNTLTTLTKRILAATGSTAPAIASLPHRRDRRSAVETTRHALARLWLAGAAPMWEKQFHRDRRRVPLPTYPFQRRRHWLDIPDDEPGERPPAPGPHSLLDSVLLRSAGQTVFRTDFAPERHWLLAEHRLLGAAIVPGTTYLEMARAAATHHLGRPVTQLEDVTFLVPLLVQDGSPRTVHTTVRDNDDGTSLFTVDSHDPASDRWTRHAQGTAHSAALPRPDTVAPESLRARCAEETLDMSARQADHQVMKFGERWVRSLHTVHVGNRAALGELTLPDRYRSECADHGLHPALLDLATGFTGFALAETAADRAAADIDRGFFLPVGYDSLVVHAALPARALSLIVPHPGTRLDGEVRSVDVHIYDETGSPVVTIRGFTTKRVTDAGRTVARLRPHSRHHTLRWVPANEEPGPATVPDRVLVVAEPDGIGAAVADDFQACGSDVVLVVLGDAWQREGDHRYVVPPTIEGFSDLLDELRSRAPVHVVHVAAPDRRTGTDIRKRLDTGVLSLFHLTRALSDRGMTPARLGVVAPGVSRLTGCEGVPSAVHGSLFGLAAVIGAESQDTEVRCVDIAAGTDPAAVRAELLGDRSAVTVALRDGVRHVRELVTLDLREHPRPEPIRADRVHLITGGLGGLGLACAEHLAATTPGVRLALFARAVPGPDDTDPRSLARLRALRRLVEAGAQVRAYAVDVTDPASVADAVGSVRADLGPIGCVLHAAGVAGDGFLFRKDTAAFRRTFDPKVLGAVAIAQATADDPPDTTVLFGSTVTVFGPAGQGDYTAANAFLDAFAEELSATGRSAVSVGWTDWLETGMAFDHGVQRDQGFFRSVPVADGLASLDEVLAARHPRVIVGEINRTRLGDPSMTATLRRSPVVLSEALRQAVADAGRVAAQGDVPGAEGPALFGREDSAYSGTERALARIWAAELGLSELNVHDSSFALGVDSLAALRIAQNIHKTMSMRVSMADMFRHVTVAELAAHLDTTNDAAEVDVPGEGGSA
ncbi:MAG: SDR family NAD(P)-dependent oxidoreductase, partial [Kibdelosporangium sp.]